MASEPCSILIEQYMLYLFKLSAFVDDTSAAISRHSSVRVDKIKRSASCERTVKLSPC